MLTHFKGPAERIQHHPTLLNTALLEDLHIVGRGGQTNATYWIHHFGSLRLGPKSTQPRILRKQIRSTLVCLKNGVRIN